MSRLQYATDIKLIRVMCTGRVDLSFVLEAFSKGRDGVLIGGCHLGDCHYVTEGNYHAIHMVLLCKKLLEYVGVNPERLCIEQVSAGEGTRFVEIVNNFSKKIRALGPLGHGEGMDAAVLTRKLEVLKRLLPNIRLVERESLRVRYDTVEEYKEFFDSKEVNRILKASIADPLALGQIMTLLRENPHSVGEISESLDLTPSEVSRHLSSSAKHGLLRYDESNKHFAAAQGGR